MNISQYLDSFRFSYGITSQINKGKQIKSNVDLLEREADSKKVDSLWTNGELENNMYVYKKPRENMTLRPEP